MHIPNPENAMTVFYIIGALFVITIGVFLLVAKVER